jgi:two-component system cell cycle response regulator
VSSLKQVLPRSDTPAWVSWALGALAVMVLAHLGHSVLASGQGSADHLFDDWLYDGVMVGCAAVCLARGLTVSAARLAWLSLGFSLACDAVAEVLSSISESFAPDVQRGLYLCFYLGAYVAIVLLGQRRVRHLRASLWLDGLSGMLAVGALGSCALYAPILMATHGAAADAAFSLAYPLADVLLIAIVIGLLAVAGWRVDRPFAFIATGFAVTAVADGSYLYELAHGTYAVGTPLDTLWLLGALILAAAAWQPDGRRVRETHSPAAIMAAPIAAGLTAIAVLADGNVDGAIGLSTWLAVAALLTVLLRLVTTSAENIRLIASSSELANHDALTGLGNRRALFDDLEVAVAEATPLQPKLLLLFDLNGFKHYNDTFGHPAGDALLQRLGRKLEERAGSDGLTYRLGGDEFCALLEAGSDPVARAAGLADALLESGEHFTIGACYGEVLIGSEAQSVDEALHIADQRLYAQKMLSSRRAASREWRDVLLGLLRARDPELDAHVQEVADLSLSLGRRLGFSTEDLTNLVAAAELHDIGKAAIPDAILDKPAPLDGEEWAFIERHTIIGERILASAPSLRPIAAIIRATHERYDGHGYPDGLSGEQIPLAARIIAICDAYEAMTSNRSYRDAMTEQQAIAELRRCAGSQFDPEITRLFLEERVDPGQGERKREAGSEGETGSEREAGSEREREVDPIRASASRPSLPAGGTPRPAM